ncbi:anoctamin-10 isoform X1 [Tribolium madens]|uniref:anoctamin-10 isoform X1 n=2 Tax=Tribolium madens TaxID=41895 RepID=UPI001CF73CFB|nr:anoctamin-10 isoform X1 [Tribolium madens]XP_044267517.1 anoctamin-10 isoform X1 [Tribolium madens]
MTSHTNRSNLSLPTQQMPPNAEFDSTWAEEDDPHIHKLWAIHRTIHTLRGKMSKQQLDASDVMSDEFDENTSLPPTYLVIKIASDIKENTLTWLIDKIRGKRRDGGAELIVMRQPSDPDDGWILHLSASKIKFLETAEEMELMKEDKTGMMREFTVGQLEDFLPDGMHVDDLLTLAEKQTIVRHELENIRALAEDEHIPGYPTYTLYEGQSIFQVCLKYKIIMKVYPLHDQEALKKLGRKWYMSLLAKQPIEEIRLYFGEAIALYFTFLGFYTATLVVPVFVGLLQLMIYSETMSLFCVFNVVWVTLVLEIWKRKSNELAFKWGTIGMTSLDEPRPNFRGSMGYDAITGKLQPQSPRYMTYIKMYCVSIPIVFLCLVAAFVMMLASFWLEEYFKQTRTSDDLIILFPSIVYSILVYIINCYYRKLATFLTEWENHRTQSQHDRHRVTKLVLFEFVNNFMSLFYIAFVVRDMEMLRSQLQTMLIIFQLISHVQEAVLPLAVKYYGSKFTSWKKQLFSSKKHSKSKFYKVPTEDQLVPVLKSLPQIPIDDSRLDSANKEGEMEDYEGTYDDYLELFIQFGYIFLFSPVYPIAAFWALFNNILEIRADAFKLCKIYQRPMSRRVKDIGAWQRCFEIIGAMSIMTNCGLLCLTPELKRSAPEVGPVEWVLFFVFLEHVLLGIRYLLHITISDKPEWVRVALAKKNYESKQALKFERSQKNKGLLRRKFKTIHGTHAR